MIVSPKLVPWLKEFNEVTVPNLILNKFKPTPTNAREGLANLTTDLTTVNVSINERYDDIVETDGYNVPVRIYIPKTKPNEKLPVIIYYHGGGHMGGSITVYEPVCRRLANATNHIVVSVEYRLTPENPYPAGVVDSYNVVKNIWKTLDAREINYKKELSIAGDSAGAANSATVSMKAQFDSEVEIKNQILIYPSLDYTMSFPSIEENAVGFLLQKSKVEWYYNCYFQNGESRKEASPVFGEFTSKLPRTLVLTAGLDPLRDEGREYVRKLKEANIDVEHYEFSDMIHTFLMMEDLVQEECALAYEKINLFLNK